MSKATCETCPYFNWYKPGEGEEGDCRKEPPALSSIGVPTHPRVSTSWVACGAHPSVMVSAIDGVSEGVGLLVVGLYERMMPRIMKLALDAADRMDEQEAARAKFHKQETCPHTHKTSVDGKGWVCTECEAHVLMTEE